MRHYIIYWPMIKLKTDDLWKTNIAQSACHQASDPWAHGCRLSSPPLYRPPWQSTIHERQWGSAAHVLVLFHTISSSVKFCLLVVDDASLVIPKTISLLLRFFHGNFLKFVKFSKWIFGTILITKLTWMHSCFVGHSPAKLSPTNGLTNLHLVD